MSTLLAGPFALLIGVVLGLFGGGGGILAVPVLVYVLGVAPKAAIAASLFFVAATSTVGAVIAAREGRVRWHVGMWFALGSLAAAYLGGRLAKFVPERLLLAALAVAMFGTAVAMLRGRSERPTTRQPLSIGHTLALGASVGLVAGLVGAGGGFLIVPALTLLGGLAMRDAIGTSLFIIAVQSFAGFAGHASHESLSASLLFIMTVAGVAGMLLGLALGRRLQAPTLRRGFGLLVLATAIFMLARQLAA